MDSDPRIFGCPANLFSGHQKCSDRSRKQASFFNLRQQSDWKQQKLPLREKKKKKERKEQKQNRRKNPNNLQPKNLKKYFVYFHFCQVKMEQEFRCLSYIYLFFCMTRFFRIRLRSWTSHCICCGCFIRNAGSICQPGSVLRLLLRDTRRQLIRRASEGQLIASSLSVPGNI